MKRGRNESVGNAIEELYAMKRKAKQEAGKHKELYVTETIKEAQNTCKRLSDRLEKLANTKSDESGIKLVDELFAILFESHKQLDKIENDYSFWTDLDNKFNG